MFKHILIPTDGSELSNRAITNGVKFAKEINARITGLTVTTPFHFIALDGMQIADTAQQYALDVKALAQRNLKVLKEAASAAGVECDVIFQASHGRRGVRALVMGSETHKVLTHTKIPVLVFR